MIQIYSDVYEGRRDDEIIPYTWFDPWTREERFSPITLEEAQQEYVTSLRGLIATGDEVTFTIQGEGLAHSGVVRQLKAIEAKLVGDVKESIGGYRDAAVSRGELVYLSVQLLGEPTPFTESGIITVGNTVEGSRNSWRTEITFIPLEAIFLAGTSLVYAATLAPFMDFAPV